ncbi:MAG TPA: hypothetical protein VKY90_04595 [Candidatus Dormibacteraeota bacterium]|nr:hypothetical protein [Candidatus Dormibacteraeota bacterium]
MHEQLSGSLSYLRRPFTSNVRAGDQVLVVTDTRHDPRVWQAVLSILADLGAEPTVAIFEPRPADYYDPPRTVREAMLRADLVVLLASTGMLHSPASMACMEAGIPTICMDGGMTLEMFQAGAATADYVEIARLRHVVGERVFGAGAKRARVTSRLGTDLTYSVEGRIYVPPPPPPGYDPFKVWRRSSEGRPSPLYTCLFPSGEFNVPPVEGTAQGRLVIDLTMHHLNRLSSPIELTIREGRIVDISGGADAWELRRYLEEFGDDNAYCCPTEASVGVNPAARVTGVQREDKNILGSMHFGLGTNIDVGGSIRSSIHMDGVVLEPTLEVDGEVRIRDGRFVVPLD